MVFSNKITESIVVHLKRNQELDWKVIAKTANRRHISVKETADIIEKAIRHSFGSHIHGVQKELVDLGLNEVNWIQVAINLLNEVS